jgi:hypothetical protein
LLSFQWCRQDLHCCWYCAPSMGVGCPAFWDHVIAWPSKTRQRMETSDLTMSYQHERMASCTLFTQIHHYTTDFWESDARQACLQYSTNCGMSLSPSSCTTDISIRDIKNLFSLHSHTQPNKLHNFHLPIFNVKMVKPKSAKWEHTWHSVEHPKLWHENIFL